MDERDRDGLLLDPLTPLSPPTPPKKMAFLTEEAFGQWRTETSHSELQRKQRLLGGSPGQVRRAHPRAHPPRSFGFRFARQCWRLRCNFLQCGHVLEYSRHRHRGLHSSLEVFLGEACRAQWGGPNPILFVFCIGFSHEILLKERILWFERVWNYWSSEPSPHLVLRARKLRFGKVKRHCLLFCHPVCHYWSVNLLILLPSNISAAPTFYRHFSSVNI